MDVLATSASAVTSGGSSEHSPLWQADPYGIAKTLEENGLRRAFLITDADGALRPSHPALEALAADITACPDFRHHQAIFLEIGRESDHLLGAFLYSTHRGQGAGGVRYWNYRQAADFLRDGLRLSLGMGHKNALAGLWWGGGKGVIARRPDVDRHDPAVRDAVFADYGRFISSLRGLYITAEDVGTTPEDMARIFAKTRYITCVPPEVGGSGNPSVLTAHGVVVAMEAALEHLGSGSLEGKTVAMQGLGNVASYMIGNLLERGVARIVGSDIDPRPIETVRQRFADAPLELRVSDRSDMSILAEACDIVAPNAIGGTLNPETIPNIQAPIVCGAANNQLAVTQRDGRALRERGILYVPDFLGNRMGIVNCANEQYGAIGSDPAITRHLKRDTPYGIFQRALEVFRRAEVSGLSTAEEAEALADELSYEKHPIWPDRGQQILNHLVVSEWDRQG